jgi:hypothetical protein
MKLPLLIGLLVAGVPIAATGQTTDGPRPERVQVTPGVVDAEVGQTIRFTAEAFDANGARLDAKPSTWFAAPFDVGGADQEGLVTMFAAGELRVGAIINGKPGWATVRIKPQQVASLAIAPTPSLVPGATARLEARTFTKDGIPREGVPVSWSISPASVAAIDAAGVVTARAPGTATVTARSEAGVATARLVVAANTVRGLSVEPRFSRARTGDVVRLTASGDRKPLPSVQWSVSGGTATIDPDGGFVAERPGNYLVTATYGTRVATASILVEARNVQRALELVGRTPLEDFQTLEQWAFGKHLYATSALSGKLWVYDISGPAHPLKVDSLSFDARILNDVSVSADGKFGVVTREGASNRKNGIVLLDTSDPAHPKVASEYTETVSGGVHSAYIDGHYVYLTDDATGSMRVIDVKDLKAPKEVGRWEVPMPDAKVYGDEQARQTGGRYLHDVQVVDGLLYAGYWRNGLVILDVGNGIKGGSPESPKFVSQLKFNYHELYGPGWLAGAHAVYRYKQYVFVGDEVFPAMFDLSSRDIIPVKGIVHVVDVSDLEHPKKVATYEVPEGGAHNMWVVDDVMYMGYYNAGARVVDVSGELRGDLYRQGREIAKLWTGDPKGFRPNTPFAWGAQLHDGLVYFNDINSGVWITRLPPLPKDAAPKQTTAAAR